MNRCLICLPLLVVLILDLGSGQDDCVTLTDGDQSNQEFSVPQMKWFETPSVIQYGAECTSEEAFGLESGAITNQQMTAFSQHSVNHGPENARLNHVADGRKMGAWSAANNNQDQWLKVDFGRNVKITKFATQGRQDANQWVKTYKLSFSEENGQTYQTYQENDADKVFNGNTDQNSVVTHTLLQPITARFVRIMPQTWNVHISMRAEFYGCVPSDRYQIVGRVVHMDFVEEHLRTKKEVIFQDQQERPNNIEVELLADTVYLEGEIKMRGIKKLTVLSRRVLSKEASELDLSAPTLTQPSKTQQFGDDGLGGKQGVPGPTVEIYADTLRGNLNILTNGGNGNPGQNGREGRKGADWGYQERPKVNQDCINVGTRASGTLVCPNVPGTPGKTGRSGQNGGYAGKSGDGGDAGHLTLYVKRVRGNMVMKTCPGKGAPAATNGAGGVGGAGTIGGLGANCERGFRSAQRRLGFLNKEGFDRFGRNKLFAPQKKCSALKKKVESVRDIALYFQTAYNNIQDEMNRQDDLRKVLKALPQTGIAQVRAQKQNLEAARDVSIKEKGLYVTGITDLEGRMENFLTQIMAKVRDVYVKAKFNKGDLIAVLQSITGFVKAGAGKDIFGALETALNTAAHFATQCSIGSLQEVKDKLTKWLTFGDAYKALEDSNDLDFDTMDIASIPELMKADLEMKQEGACSRPRLHAGRESTSSRQGTIGGTDCKLFHCWFCKD
ncbi:hypothetical protein ACROYT_G027990 [Oculina patagonica]